MKAYVVFSVDCDGGRHGCTYKMKICLSRERAEEYFQEWTNPIAFCHGPQSLFSKKESTSATIFVIRMRCRTECRTVYFT